jgi:hypothetical protein
MWRSVRKGAKVILVSLIVLALLPVLWAVRDGRRAVEATRQELRKAGFKTELAEFDFSTSSEDQVRVGPLTNFGDGFGPDPRANLLRDFVPGRMPLVGSNSAISVWREEKLPISPRDAGFLEADERWLQDDVWPLLRSLTEGQRESNWLAVQAAISGSIRFHLDAKQGTGMLLPYLPALKKHALAFGRAMVLELREGNKEAAWTNLLAASRLVTAWRPEATEISAFVRFVCGANAFHTLWQGLPAGWSDEQLASLQRDWESVDYFKDLPEMAAFRRAIWIDMIRREREELYQRRVLFPKLLTNPRDAWTGLQDYQEQLRYRRYGTFEEETQVMLYYRDRETEIRNAIDARTWSKMRGLPGVTNAAPYKQWHSSRLSAMVSSQQGVMAILMQMSAGGVHTLVGKAADAEARRELIVTAIALERFRAKHGSYPTLLSKLAPEFVKEEPIDFMDGKPLRYRLSDDGGYLLYSVGLDCVDDGGLIREENPGETSFDYATEMKKTVERDLVWPRVASESEIRAFRAAENAA